MYPVSSEFIVVDKAGYAAVGVNFFSQYLLRMSGPLNFDSVLSGRNWSQNRDNFGGSIDFFLVKYPWALKD